jgi:uncharacterized protein YggE
MMRNTALGLAAIAGLLVTGAQTVAAQPIHGLQTASPGGTIEVSGRGEARANPDLASLSLAIETHAATAEQSASQNAELTQKVVAALKARLGNKGKIWTGGYSLYPEYSGGPAQEKPKVIGYRAENSISLETGSIDLVGSLIDAAIAAGANRINALSFSLKDESPARNEAIARASKDAQLQAQALAGALGVRLKRVINASTGGEAHPVPVMGRMLATMAVSAPTPVQANEVIVPAMVYLTYEIDW